uniref:Uncharacterized protein n=1 Tax=Nelumbo nucifera TaxID=4432 RepID=A0A822XL06_NELNU|nr:TPA_asm: hypothetical protein HUJ06_022145 [Nelumbo nucifera]
MAGKRHSHLALYRDGSTQFTAEGVSHLSREGVSRGAKQREGKGITEGNFVLQSSTESVFGLKFADDASSF